MARTENILLVRERDVLKVIRKFFLNHNKSFRWHLGDYEKLFFFPFEGLREAWVLLKTGLYKLNGGSGRRHAGAHAPAGHTIHP